MNFALSQRRTDRHPVGLMIVVGLHVLLAAALLSAKLTARPPEVVPIPLQPLEPPRTIVPKTVELPLPPARTLPKYQAPLPIIPSEQKPTVEADRHDDKVVPPEPVVVIARAEVKPAEVPHFTARPAHVNAGAASCRPVYPQPALRASASGVTRIRFTLDAAGKVSATQILQSSGPTREHRLMDEAAAQALAQCPMTAGSDDTGRAVGGIADVDYVWTLN